MCMGNATEIYRQARDQLLGLGGDVDKAVAQFEWPDLGERFNWAVDWFDAIARGNQRPALVIVEEDGSSSEVTFDADGAPLGPGRRLAGCAGCRAG